MKAPKVMTIAAVLGFALFTMGQPALAQSNCQQVKGLQEAVFDPVTNTSTGSITKGGLLNGTALEVFGTAVAPTPDPTTVSFTADFTIATTHGDLNVSNVYILDFVSGVAAIFGRINPTASTGMFAGATGVLYIAGKTVNFDPFTVQGEVTGEICFEK
jgi:hypothetical protein